MPKRGPSAAKALSREDILGADDLPRTRVPVPEWKGVLYVRSLTAGERDRWEGDILRRRALTQDKPDEVFNDLRATLIAMCAVDKDGAALFAPDDIPALSAKSAKAVDRVFAAAQKINGVSDDDVEDLKGNS